jgi:uncharacterized surface protein with fasciclin (FAS1) repeats
MRVNLLLLLCTAILLSVSIAHAQLETRTLAQVLAETEEFSLFYAALEETVVTIAQLSNPDGLYTVFAVENEAFQYQTDRWQDAIRYVIPGEFTSYELNALQEPTPFLSLAGSNLSIVAINGDILINDYVLTATDTMASNGVIHTLSAPLPYHPPDVEFATRPGYNMMFRPMDTAIASLAAHPQFTWFAAAADSAGLAEMLDHHTFTIFAFTNASFETFIQQEGYATVQEALADHGKMRILISYHVIPVGFLWESFHYPTPTRLGTLYPGQSLLFEDDLINGVSVTAWDIPTDSCYIHLIDAVLTPPTLAESAP